MSSSKQTSELFGKSLERPIRTVYDVLAHPAKEHGSKLAVVSMHQPASLYSAIAKADTTINYLRWSFDEIIRVSHVMALALTTSGVRSGMIIAAFVENNIEAQILFRATLELNCPLALLNPKSAGNHRELLHIFEILQPSVVVVPNLSVAKLVDEAATDALRNVCLRLVCGGKETLQHWQSFGAFLEAGFTPDQPIIELEIERKPEDVVLIFFTSGTTSLPKGVPHTNVSWATVLLGNPLGFGILESSISCSHLPFFHCKYHLHLLHSVKMLIGYLQALGLAFLLYFNAHGCTAVIPAPAFNPKATLSSIYLEGTNIFPSLPAMNSALLNHPDYKKTTIIDQVIIGTTSVTPEYLQKTVAEFGAKRICDGYGLTETGAIWFHRTGTKPNDMYPCPEMMVRVCDPETDEILPRGVYGELHCGGSGVITRYMLSKEQGEAPNKAFYKDNFGHWLRTGDQVVMDENGEMRVLGRYKDLIKRGGENLSPSLIELVLAEDFGLVAEVIGIPDEIVGEYPIAIVKGSQNYDLTDIRGKLVKKLGSLFALEDIITVEDIGLDDFPKTHTGKTKKHVLREKAIEYLKAAASSREHNSHDVVQIETLTALWSKHLGVSNLSPQQNILEIADSLSFARFSAALRKATGNALSLKELLDNPTIESQAQILVSHKNAPEITDYSNILSTHIGPPTSNDMIHATGDEYIYQRTQQLGQRVLLLLGLSWNDVEEVIPMHATMKRLLERKRNQSNNHRHTWLCRGKTVKELEEALKKALVHNSMLRAMAIHYDSKLAMHLIVRPSQTLYSKMLIHMPPVKNAEDLWKQSYNGPDDWAAYPGPLFRATLSYVEQENCAGLVYMGQHSTFDALSFEMFLEDLDALLVDPHTSLMSRVPYKAWADSLYNLDHSAAAQHSITWQTKRLEGISKYQSSLFPVERAPEWFKGQSDGWLLPDGNPGSTRKALDGGATDGAIGTVQQVKLEGAKSLKLLHGIEVPQIAKAALAIICARRTKSNVALFGQYQAGRSWPFLPDWQTKLLPDVMNVAGPTVQSTAVMVNVDSTDTVSKLLLELQEEQADLNTHSHAPYDQVVDRLNEGGTKDGDVLVEIIRRQIFNWLPGGGLSAEYKSLQKVQAVSRADVGILWNVSMINEDTLQVHISWDDAQLSGHEATELLREFAVVIMQLSKEKNWWKTVGDLTC